MGYKASMIIIKKPAAMASEEELLKELGFDKIMFMGDTTLDECIYPKDKSLNIGYYNDCIIIADDYQLTTSLELSKSPHLLSDYEKVLTGLYPKSEILSVACHSVVDYHLYSLVKDGEKLRFKKSIPGEEIVEYGKRMAEEETVYANSKLIDGQRMFRGSSEDEEDYDYTEDQMMEDFTFGVAKRHLGVMISTTEDEPLMFDTPFKKYTAKKVANQSKQMKNEPGNKDSSKNSWLSRLFKK